MRILILGGSGMLGHQLMLSLPKIYDIRVTLRREKEIYRPFKVFNDNNSYYEVDICNHDKLLSILTDFQPEAVINAIGVVKQHTDAPKISRNIEVNALFPHYLQSLCYKINTRLIHISTDCVFSGNRGGYTENAKSDADDLYGRCKYLGEVNSAHTITLRTSFIGLELLRKRNLLEWFLAQQGKIAGFRKAIFSGFTTLEMCNVISTVLRYPGLTGIWHVASSPISKYDLLVKISTLLQRTDIEIEPNDHFVCNRSLSASAFQADTGYQAPTWDVMLEALVNQIRKANF